MTTCETDNRMPAPEAAVFAGVETDTIYRWASRGVRLRRSGERIFLPVFRRGGRLECKASDIEAFLAKCNEPAPGRAT